MDSCRSTSGQGTRIPDIRLKAGTPEGDGLLSRRKAMKLTMPRAIHSATPDPNADMTPKPNRHGT